MRCTPDIDGPQGGTRAERIVALRKIVHGSQVMPAGVVPGHVTAGAGASFAPGLPGPGLIGGALNELTSAHGDQAAAFGFMFALAASALQQREGPALFIAAERTLGCGAVYSHGLHQLGLDVGRLILVDTETDKDALWALEDVLRARAKPAVVIGALDGSLDLTQSRRLNLAAAMHVTPLVVWRSAHVTGPNAAVARWRIAPAPAVRDRFDTFTYWRWHVTLERCRNGRTSAWLLEWGHVARHFRSIETPQAVHRSSA